MVELPLPAQRPGEVRSFVVLRKFAVGVRGSRLLHKADLCGETANIMRCIVNSLVCCGNKRWIGIGLGLVKK